MSAFLRKYATATRIYVPIIKRGVVDYAVGADWTPAASDVKVSIDGGAAANIGTLPTAITMGNAAYWDFTISSGETTGKKIVVTVSDSATKAVEDQCFLIETYGHASAEYQADLSAANLPAAVNSIAANAITATSIASSAITSAKFASSAITSTVLATDAITAAKIATDAITAAKIATDAITEIQSGLSTLTQSQVTGGAYALNSASFAFNAALDFTTTQKAATLARVALVDTTTTNTDMRGTNGAYTGTPPTASDISSQVNSDITTAHGAGSYQTATGFSVPGDAMALTSGERTSVATAVWSSATRTLSSFGTLIADIWSYVTRTLTSGAAPSAAENAAAVWDKPLSEHVTAGSAGAALSAAQAAGDPWSTTVPGAYASGTAGHKFGNLPSSAGIASALTGVSSVEFMGSPMQGPRVILVRGSAYLKSQEMAPYQRIAKAAYPDMGLDTVVGFRMKVYRSDDTFEVMVDGVIESYDATYWNLYADLSSADTALLIVGEGVAQFWVELDGIDEEITVSEYKLTVKHGVGVA